MKTGIIGGTFDPLHNGHLYIARQAMEEYGLGEVWFMPAGMPYFKEKKEVTAAKERLLMTQLGIAGDPGFVCSDYEVRKEGRTYTAETLRELKAACPDRSFYFILGADSLLQMKTWYQPEVILQSAVILCAGREGEERLLSGIAELREQFRESGCDIRLIHCENLPVSSTMIREMVSRGEDIRGLVPAGVADYIAEKKLYQVC